MRGRGEGGGGEEKRYRERERERGKEGGWTCRSGCYPYPYLLWRRVALGPGSGVQQLLGGETLDVWLLSQARRCLDVYMSSSICTYSI